MRNITITYLTVLVVFTVVDCLWIGLTAIDFYRKELGSLMLVNPRVGPVAVFYALYAAGLTILAVQPSLNGGEWHWAAIRGAVFGLCAYGTYDLTNMATLQRWPLAVVIVDMTWGTLLTSLAAWCGFLVGSLNWE